MNREFLRTELESLHQASFAWARRCCGGDDLAAEDILQIAYVKVLSGGARFSGHSTLKTWFFGVIRLTALEVYRRELRERQGKAKVREEGVFARSTAEVDPRIAEVRQFMEQLPGRQREVIHLVFIESMTVEEASRVMDVTVGTARQHYHRAKEKIRKWMDDER